MKESKDYIRKHVDTIILNILQEGDSYGYEILKNIEEKSEGVYAIKQPTLYNCLARLEKIGYISSYQGDESNGGKRKYFTLTQVGIDVLEKETAEWEFSRTLVGKLLSNKEYDLSTPPPFDPNKLRPMTKRIQHNQQDESNYKEHKPQSEDTEPYSSAPMQNYETHQTASSKKIDHSERMIEIANALAKAKHEKATTPTIPISSNPYTDTNLAYSLEDIPENEEIIENIHNLDPNSQNYVENTQDYQHNEYEESDNYSEVPSQVSRLRGFALGRDDSKRKQKEKKELQNSKSYNLLFGKGETVDATAVQATTPSNKGRNKNTASHKQLSITEAIELYQEETAKREQIGCASTSTSNFFSSLSEIEKIPNQEQQAPQYNQYLEQVADYNDYPNEETPVNMPATLKRSPKGSRVVENIKYRELREDEVMLNTDPYKVRLGEIFDNSYMEEIATPVARNQNTAHSISSLASKMSIEGHQMRPYSRAHTTSYYLSNFIHSNQINKDCSTLLYMLMVVEIFVLYFFADASINLGLNLYITFASALLIAPVALWIKYAAKPFKRTKAKFSFKVSILTSIMVFLNLLVIIMLVGFFAFSADISNFNSMLEPIIVPTIIIANIPLSTIIYSLLYNSGRYNVKTGLIAQK